MGKVNVIQDAEEEVPKEVLATAILKISDSAEQLRASGVNQKAIVVLLADSTKLPKRTINKVLEGLYQLRNDYCGA